MLKPILYSLVGMLLLAACETRVDDVIELEENEQRLHIEQKAKAYFQTYAEREDWQEFLSFYREDMQFEDVLLQIQLDSLWQFERFYNWPDTNFQKLTPEQPSLVLSSLVSNDSMAVARGHFTPFYWHGNRIEPIWGMEFCIWLYFDKDQKIKRQIDWIEYDPDVLESVINRVRKDGLKMPTWLDLSK